MADVTTEKVDGQRQRPLEEIAAEIDMLDARIAELGSKKAQLVMEHDEAIAGRLPRVF